MELFGIAKGFYQLSKNTSPYRIQKQYDSDIFVYAYLLKDSSKFTIEEPYISGGTYPGKSGKTFFLF